MSAAILDGCEPRAVIGVDPSDGFLATAGEHLSDRATLRRGSATELPLPDRSVEAVVSGLVLNFVADQAAALAETARVAVPGGTVAASVWDHAGRMELMRQFRDAAVAIDADAASLDEGVRFPLCRPAALEKLFVGAKLEQVAVAGIDIATPFASFDDYWEPFLGGQGPAPADAMSLPEAARARLRDRIREGLPHSAQGSFALVARAWAVRGVIPAAS